MAQNNRTINIILGILVVVLAGLCTASLTGPQRFDKERAKREADVKKRLLVIREGEKKFKSDNGYFCESAERLAESGYIADSMKFIPYSKSTTFRLRTTTIVTEDGQQSQVMECGATYRDYLEGMDENTIKNLMDDAESQGRYPGLRFGDLEKDNGNATNWD